MIDYRTVNSLFMFGVLVHVHLNIKQECNYVFPGCWSFERLYHRTTKQISQKASKSNM